MKIMKDAVLLVIGAVIAFALIKVNEVKTTVNADVPQTQTQQHQQRFVPIQTAGVLGAPVGFLALDTKGGSLCRTYDNMEGHHGTLPLCSYLALTDK